MTPKEFENYLDDRVGQMMARNRVIKYVPKKKNFWERVKQWVNPLFIRATTDKIC